MRILILRKAKFIFGTVIFIFGVFQNLHSQSCADGSFSYDNDILPILAAKCGSCHTVNSTAGFNVLTYNALLAGGTACGPGVTPGDASPVASSLIDKTQWVIGANNAICGNNMPTAGTPLTPDEYLAIQTWISNGAQESCAALADCIASHGNLEIKSVSGFSGCTDPQANNYDPNAIQDNGSCTYDKDLFLGEYTSSLECPNDPVLMSISTDALGFIISPGLDPSDCSSVIITFTSGVIAGLSFLADVNGNNLTIPLTSLQGLPFNVGGVNLILDISLSGQFSLQSNQLIGQINLTATQSSSGAILGSDICDFIATRL